MACIYTDCKERQKTLGALSFFRLPTDHRRAVWLKHGRIPCTKPLPKSQLMCEKHFYKKDILVRSTLKVLTKIALPISTDSVCFCSENAKDSLCLQIMEANRPRNQYNTFIARSVPVPIKIEASKTKLASTDATCQRISVAYKPTSTTSPAIPRTVPAPIQIEACKTEMEPTSSDATCQQISVAYQRTSTTSPAMPRSVPAPIPIKLSTFNTEPTSKDATCLQILKTYSRNQPTSTISVAIPKEPCSPSISPTNLTSTHEIIQYSPKKDDYTISYIAPSKSPSQDKNSYKHKVVRQITNEVQHQKTIRNPSKIRKENDRLFKERINNQLQNSTPELQTFVLTQLFHKPNAAWTDKEKELFLEFFSRSFYFYKFLLDSGFKMPTMGTIYKWKAEIKKEKKASCLLDIKSKQELNNNLNTKNSEE